MINTVIKLANHWLELRINIKESFGMSCILAGLELEWGKWDW